MSVSARLRAACLLAGIAVSGCGHATHIAPGAKLQIGLIEYRLAPGAIVAHAGRVTLVVANLGHLTHNLAVSRGARTLEVSPPIAPGARITLQLDLAPGHYTLASSLFDDEALGLYGSVTATR